MNIWLFVFLLSPLPILIALYFAQAHSKKLRDVYNTYKAVLLNYEKNYFGGNLIKFSLFFGGWIVPVFYASLMVFMITYFYKNVHPKMLNPHTYLYNLLLFLLCFTFVGALFTRPLKLTKQNYNDYVNLWPNDELIFFGNQDCQTCHIPKVARSKHCKYCGSCYLMYDHHCVWLNNCIGWGNYQWFYSFLAMNTIVLSYASVITFKMIHSEWVSFSKWGHLEDELFLGFLCFSFDMIMIWFVYINLSVIKDGMTTNEYQKWAIVHEIISEGNLYKSKDKTSKDLTYYEYLDHEDVFVSINQKDNAVQSVNRSDLVKINGVDQVENIYDCGSLWGNFNERLSYV